MQRTDRFIGPLAESWGDAATSSGLAALLRPAGDALPIAPATHRDVWAIGPGSADQPTLRRIRHDAERELGSPWPQPTATAYARYFRDGNRTQYESAVFARDQRLSRAIVMAAATLSTTWVDEAADGLTLLCEQSTWCWPAHDDTFARHGAVVPTITSPFLDLGAGEVVSQLAWADRLLGPTLDDRVPGLRARLRHEAAARVFGPLLDRSDWHWLGVDRAIHNWNPWILGNVLVAALQLVSDDGARAHLVATAIEGMDRYVAALPADGAIDEGFGYWWNGACRAIEALDVLAYATGGALDSGAVEALRATVAFPYRMHLSGPWYLNAADGSARVSEDLPWHAAHRAAVAIGDENARRQAAAHRRPGEPVGSERFGLGRLLRALTDSAWIGELPAKPPLVRDVWLGSTQLMLARVAQGSERGLCLAVKGGHNGENHNHNDVGNVVVALNGVPVVVDAGRPTYTAATFGPDRYDIWTMQSAWHNVPEPRGTAQAPGCAFAAHSVEPTFEPTKSAVRMDLAKAYPRDDLLHWWRLASLDRDTGEVAVVDSWEFAEGAAAQSSCVRYLLAGEVRLTNDGVVIQALDDAGAIVLRWEATDLAAQLTTRDLDDPILTRVWGTRLTRLTLDLGAAVTGTITVRLKEAR